MNFFAQVEKDTYQVMKVFQSDNVETLKEIYGDHLYIPTYVGLSTHNFAGREESFWHPEYKNFYYKQKPFPSWKLNSECNWEAPIPFPYDPKKRNEYHWIEEAYQSDNTKGWERLKILPEL